ncbi:MAG: FtsX-like permease family protein [Methanomicrobiales archaeon]|nr:FtsX-like permease family protein [Methanomicrobiales archaeon]
MNYLTYLLAGIRNKAGRNLATAFCFAFIAANIFSGQYLTSGAGGSVDQGVSRMGADHLVVPAQYQVFSRGFGPENTFAVVRAEPSTYRIRADIMATVGSVQGVMKMSPQLYVATLREPALSPSPVEIYGIDPATDFTIQPWLQHPLSTPMSPGEVIVGHEIKGDISSQISLSSHTYTVAGRLDPTQSPIDRTIFLRMDDAYALAATEGIVPSSDPRVSYGDINAVLLQGDPGEGSDLVAARIRRAFSPTYITVISRHFSLDPALQEIKDLPRLLTYISLIVVVAALPLISLIAAMVAHERQREIGLIRSMGAKRHVIISLVFAESLILAATGGIFGVGVSLIAFTLISTQIIDSSALHVSFALPTVADIGMMAGVALLVVITLGSISSIYPAYQSSTISPYDAIRKNG